MIKRIAFTMAPVKNMERARRFYEGDLGLKPGDDFQGMWQEYDLGGGCFAITTYGGGASTADAGSTVTFEVDDVKRRTEELRQKGIRVKLEPMETPVCWMSIVLDPDGNGVGLHQLK